MNRLKNSDPLLGDLTLLKHPPVSWDSPYMILWKRKYDARLKYTKERS